MKHGTAHDNPKTAMRLLVIEDEAKLAAYLHKGLSENGYVVDVAATGIDGRHMALEGSYDLYLLDVMLPGVDGFGVLKSIRARGNTPVLMLTARARGSSSRRRSSRCSRSSCAGAARSCRAPPSRSRCGT